MYTASPAKISSSHCVHDLAHLLRPSGCARTQPRFQRFVTPLPPRWACVSCTTVYTLYTVYICYVYCTTLAQLYDDDDDDDGDGDGGDGCGSDGDDNASDYFLKT